MARAYATAALCFALTLLLSAGVTKSANPPATSPSPDADGPPDDDQPLLNFTSNPASLPEFPRPSLAMPPSPSVSPSPAPSYGADADAPPATPPAADHFGGKLVASRATYGSAATKYML